jgi:hypothetical protein
MKKKKKNNKMRSNIPMHFYYALNFLFNIERYELNNFTNSIFMFYCSMQMRFIWFIKHP